MAGPRSQAVEVLAWLEKCRDGGHGAEAEDLTAWGDLSHISVSRMMG